MANDEQDSIFDPFDPQDYWPFVFGIVVLAGFIAVPILWGFTSGIDYGSSIVPSLLSCGVFIFAHDKRGNFSIFRLILGLIIQLIIMVKLVSMDRSASHSMFIASGVGAYIIILACGRAGIKIARFYRRKN